MSIIKWQITYKCTLCDDVQTQDSDDNPPEECEDCGGCYRCCDCGE